MRRDKLKDAYDVVWLLDALGPEQAAEMTATSALMRGSMADQVGRQLSRLIDDQFRDIRSAGPMMYAEFLDAQPGDMERRHAQGSVHAFSKALADLGVQLP